VRVANIDVTWSSSYETVRWYYDGDCFGVETEYSDEPYDGYRYSYEDDGYRYGYESNQYDDFGYGGLGFYGSEDPFELCRSDPIGEVDEEDAWLAGTGWAFLGAPHPAVTVAEIDGRWYVSPVRSVLDSVLEVLRSAEQEDVEAFLDSWFGGWGEARFEEVGRALPDDDYDDPYGDYSDDEYFDNKSPGDSDDYTGSFDGDPLTPCWDVLEGDLLSGMPPQRSLWLSQAAFNACAQDLVAEGEIEESDLPPLGYVDDACWAPYEQLSPDAREDLWAAADAQVEQCLIDSAVGSRPPG
jgi:hypothetical protein